MTDGAGPVEAAPGGVTPNPVSRLSLPVLWVALVILYLANGFVAYARLAFEPSIPDAVVYWAYFEMGAAIVIILWGLWLLGAAFRRSPGFPRAFAAWHGANVLAIAGSAAMTLTIGDFVFMLSSYVVPAARIVVGFLLILLLRRAPAPVAASDAGAERPPVIVYVINALLGAIVGAAAGAAAGLGIGSILAEVFDISCFEGGCGYYVAAFGLLGLVLGLPGGAALALWATGRKAVSRVAG